MDHTNVNLNLIKDDNNRSNTNTNTNKVKLDKIDKKNIYKKRSKISNLLKATVNRT